MRGGAGLLNSFGNQGESTKGKLSQTTERNSTLETGLRTSTETADNIADDEVIFEREKGPKRKPPPPPQYRSRWMRRQQTATMGDTDDGSQPRQLGHQDGGAQPGAEARDGASAGNFTWVSSAGEAQEAVRRMLEEQAPRIGYCHECKWWHELPRCYSFETSVRTQQQEHGRLAGRASA
jgi:hypothetical protein